MDVVTFFLDQLEREQAINRRVLGEVPEGRNDWKPHDRSMALGYLSSLVAQMPAWIAMMLQTEAFDLADKATAGRFQRNAPLTNRELLALGEESYSNGRRALQSTDGESLKAIWTLRMGDKVLSSAPRLVQIADTFTHLAHHRGQLTVYLRLNGAKVPSTYGPSADEAGS